MKNMMEVGKYINDSIDGLYQTYSMVAISFIPAPAQTSFAVQAIYLKDRDKRESSVEEIYNKLGAASVNFRNILLFPYLHIAGRFEYNNRNADLKRTIVVPLQFPESTRPSKRLFSDRYLFLIPAC